MNFKDFIKEEFEQWTGRWIHYSHGVPRYPPYLTWPDGGATQPNPKAKNFSKVPLLKINYNMMWDDPLGMYFFPEKFKSQGGWHEYEFKFVVEFPESIRVFDFAKLTDQEVYKILRQNDIEPIDKAKYYSTKRPPAYYLWKALRDNFHHNKMGGGVEKSKLNKFFRDMGYDAIFDDTNTIFSGETQLILLNPKVKYKVIDVIKQSTSGWNELSQITARVEELCKPYGNVKVKRDNKKYSGWDNGYVLKARVSVNEEQWKEGPYVSWELSTTGVHKGSPTAVHVCLSGATPRHEDLFRSSQCATIEFRSMNLDELDRLIPRIMQRIWKDQTAAA